jgi:hypothetical protein
VICVVVVLAEFLQNISNFRKYGTIPTKTYFMWISLIFLTECYIYSKIDHSNTFGTGAHKFDEYSSSLLSLDPLRRHKSHKKSSDSVSTD